MRDVILTQHEQIPRSLDLNSNIKIAGEFDSIILAGLGGSGHPGDLINALGISYKPLYVHRNYDLPLGYLQHMGLTKPLAIISSYSGNTEEALSAYEAARQAGLQILISSSGGKLAELAERDDVPAAKIGFLGMQPRHTLFAAFTGIYAALKNNGLVEDITSALLRVAGVLKSETPQLEEIGEKLADNIKGKVPVFISSDTLGFAAKNFKIQTNENAKYPAFWNTFPELNHNELVGFSKLKEKNLPHHFIAVILRSSDDHPRVQTRMDVTAQLYEEWGAHVEQINVLGATVIEKLFRATILGLWTTYFLARAYNIDPVPVAGVEDFKKRLKK